VAFVNKPLAHTFALLALAALCLLGLIAPAWAADAPAVEPLWAQPLQELTRSATQAAPGTRVAVEVGQLDPRLRLAPCDQIQAYLPPNTRPWGKARIGLRCLQGSVRWNVYLPVTVKVFATALVAAQPLPAGSVLAATDLREAEVDLAAAPAAAITRSELAVGRTLARALAAGDGLRQSDLKPRQWFAAGDTVRIDAVGAGYAVSGEGQALSHGLEGQSVRVRTDSGRIVTGQAVAERRVEMAL